jgi:hypothetical protein
LPHQFEKPMLFVSHIWSEASWPPENAVGSNAPNRTTIATRAVKVAVAGERQQRTSEPQFALLPVAKRNGLASPPRTGAAVAPAAHSFMSQKSHSDVTLPFDGRTD